MRTACRAERVQQPYRIRFSIPVPPLFLFALPAHVTFDAIANIRKEIVNFMTVFPECAAVFTQQAGWWLHTPAGARPMKQCFTTYRNVS
jgi:hypothetical protein